MFATGDPDRAPVRCTEPVGVRAHRRRSRVRGADRAVERQAATGRRVDAGGRARREHGRAARTSRRPGYRGRRAGASIGRTREIWPTLDGFVSFGLRGGKARVASLETLTKLVVADGIPADVLTSQDWNTYNQNTATDEELDAIATAVAEYFSRHSDAGALRHRVRDQPDARARELAEGDLRVGATRVARLLRTRRRRRPVPALVRGRALGRR